MAGKGRKFTFHGSYKSKRQAVRKERSAGGFIRTVCFGGSCRHTVLKPRKRK